MSNPFDALHTSDHTTPKPHEDDEWEGAFSCQQVGCYDTAHRAYYNPKERTLYWTCGDGHENVVVGIE